MITQQKASTCTLGERGSIHRKRIIHTVIRQQAATFLFLSTREDEQRKISKEELSVFGADWDMADIIFGQIAVKKESWKRRDQVLKGQLQSWVLCGGMS